MKIKHLLISIILVSLASCAPPPTPEAIIQQQAADMQANRDSAIQDRALELQAEIDRLVRERNIGVDQVLKAEVDSKNTEIIRLNGELRALEHRSFNNYFFFGVAVLILLGIIVALVVAYVSKPSILPAQTRTSEVVPTNYRITKPTNSTQIVSMGQDVIMVGGNEYTIPLELSMKIRDVVNRQRGQNGY